MRLWCIMKNIKSEDKIFRETYLSFQLLRYLPRKYDGIIIQLSENALKDFMFDRIIMELVAEETSLMVRKQNNVKYVPIENTVDVKARQPSKKSIKCWHCGNNVHIRNKCRKFLSWLFQDNITVPQRVEVLQCHMIVTFQLICHLLYPGEETAPEVVLAAILMTDETTCLADALVSQAHTFIKIRDLPDDENID